MDDNVMYILSIFFIYIKKCKYKFLLILIGCQCFIINDERKQELGKFMVKTSKGI